MTRVGDPIPELVFVPVAGGQHIVYAATEADIEAHGADTVYATTLCGLACGRGPVRNRREARDLPLCATCLEDDLRRYPDGPTRRLLRQTPGAY